MQNEETFMNTPHKLAALALLLSTFNFQLSTCLAQGSLTPPGAPAPTMKTLAQIEPRTPISAAPFTISQPGSYYLTTNLTGVSGSRGITITASDVTLDLGGFAVIGVPGSLDGINVLSIRTNVTVGNGTVRGWSGDGVDVNNAYRTTLRSMRACANSGSGIYSGIGSVVSECIATGNGNDGIHIAGESVVRDCVAMENGGFGIYTASLSTVINCTANFNTNSGIVSDGSGLVSGCTANRNSAHGISLWSGGDVTSCVAEGNIINGIVVSSMCRVIGNSCTGNGAGAGAGAGVRITGNSCRVEDNNVTGNDWGVRVDIAGNFIVRNTARGNGTNYLTSGTQTIGPIITATGTITTNSPWANFEF